MGYTIWPDGDLGDMTARVYREASEASPIVRAMPCVARLHTDPLIV